MFRLQAQRLANQSFRRPWVSQLRLESSITAMPSAASSAAPPTAPSNAPPAAPSTATPIQTDPADKLKGMNPVFLAKKPLPKTHGIQVATVHFRSWDENLTELTFFSNFAVRAAHAMGIPTSGVASLRTNRTLYTVPRSPFAHKKSQENFERIVHRRAVRVYDANPETVSAWVEFLIENGIEGVGFKVQNWEFKKLGWGRKLVEELPVPVNARTQILELVPKLQKELEKEVAEGSDKLEAEIDAVLAKEESKKVAKVEAKKVAKVEAKKEAKVKSKDGAKVEVKERA